MEAQYRRTTEVVGSIRPYECGVHPNIGRVNNKPKMMGKKMNLYEENEGVYISYQ